MIHYEERLRPAGEAKTGDQVGVAARRVQLLVQVHQRGESVELVHPRSSVTIPRGTPVRVRRSVYTAAPEPPVALVYRTETAC